MLNIRVVTNANVPTCKVTGPMPSKQITEQDGHYFMLMTEIFQKLHYPQMTCTAEHKYSKRISEWAARLPRIASNHVIHDKDNNHYNVFESMTSGLTFLGED